MRIPSPRYFVSVFLTFALPATAALTYSVKPAEAELFRTEALEPPPLATLAQGQILNLIYKGAASSMLETETGVKGWMRNSDLLAMSSAPGQDFRFKTQKVIGGGEYNNSELIPGLAPSAPEIFPIDRTFDGEIVQPMDREQVEMRHDEN